MLEDSQKEEVQTWRTAAADFLKRARDDEQPAPRRRREQIQGVPSYRHLVNVDAALQRVLGEGQGLNMFVLARPIPPWGLRLCSVLVKDHAPVNIYGRNYLLHHQGL